MTDMEKIKADYARFAEFWDNAPRFEWRDIPVPMSEELLKYICTHPDDNITFRSLCSRLQYSRQGLEQLVAKCGDELPEKDRLFLWFFDFMYRRLVPMERNSRKIQMSEALNCAFQDDSGAAFIMTMDMGGTRLSYSLLRMIIDNGKYDIFYNLVKEKKIAKVMNDFEFVTMILHEKNQEKILRLLEIAETASPGMLKNTFDENGMNLLWYTISASRIVWHDPYDPVISFLLAKGCDMGNKNQFALSWRTIRNGAPEKLKIAKRAKKSWDFAVDDVRRQYPGAVVPWSGMTVNMAKKYTRKNNMMRPEFRKHIVPLLQALREDFRCRKVPLPAGMEPLMQKKYLTLPEKIAVAEKIFKTGVAVYHPQVRDFIISSRLPGWEALSCFGKQELRRFPGEKEFLAAVEADDVQKFSELWEKSGLTDFPEKLAHMVFSEKAGEILGWLIDENPVFRIKYPPEKLLFYAAAQLDDQAAAMVVGVVRARVPEIVKNAVDSFGSNIFWYAAFNPAISLQRNSCFYKSTGCGKYLLTQANRFGIAAVDAVDK